MFDGYKKSDYTEKSTTNPLNYYGKTKSNGDESIINSGCKFYILEFLGYTILNLKKFYL